MTSEPRRIAITEEQLAGEVEDLLNIFQWRWVDLSDTDVYSQALLTAHLYQMSLDAKAIESIKECSRCGRPMPHGGERGLVKDSVPYSFCSEECYRLWEKEND